MNKEEFKARTNKTIDLISAKLNDLKAEKASAESDAKTEIENKINTLENNQNDLQSTLENLEATSEEKWNDIKNSFETTLNKSENALESIKNKITA